VVVEDEEPRALAELKGRPLWQSVLRTYVRSLVPAPTSLEFEVDGERHTLTAPRIRRAVEAAASGRNLHAARRRFFENVHELLTDAVVQRHEALLAGVEDGFEDILARVDASLAKSGDGGLRSGATGSDVDGAMTDEDIDRVRARIGTDHDIAGVLDDFWPLHDPRQTLQSLLADDALLRVFAPWLERPERAMITAHATSLAPSDIALLDAVTELIGATEVMTDQGEFLAERAAAQQDWAYGHVVVDEAQELSAMGWHMVARRVPSRSITAVGDIDQTEAPHRHATWDQAIAPVFGDRWRRGDLTICYRTPREVMALTPPVLERAGSHNEPPRAVRDAGVEPWEVTTTSHELAHTVADLTQTMTARWQGGTVGVVAPRSRIESLREHLPDTVVLAATEAKGLEWDATLVVDPDGIIAEPRGWNGLYVALTRCTQELGQVRLIA
jgi:hypothetical protein